MKSDLKPCPFCGGTQMVPYTIPGGHEIECRRCGAMAAAFGADSVAKAVAAWNAGDAVARTALAGEAATAAKTPKSGLVHEHATAQPERPNWCLIIAVSLSVAVVSALWIVGGVS